MKQARNKKKSPPKSVAVKIGRLRQPIAKAIGRKAADIYLTPNAIAHIQSRHGKELSALGYDAETYALCIITCFNQVRRGNGTSLLLVCHKSDYHDVAAIDMSYDYAKKVWVVKTAQPRSTAKLEKHELLWERKR